MCEENKWDGKKKKKKKNVLLLLLPLFCNTDLPKLPRCVLRTGGAHPCIFDCIIITSEWETCIRIINNYSSNRKLVWAGRCHLPGGVRTYLFFMKLSSVFIMFFVLARWLGRSTVARTSNERMLRPLFSACVTAGISSQPQSRRGTLYSYSYSYTRLYTRLHYRCLI